MEKVAEILGVPKEKLEELEKVMREKGFEPAIEKVAQENNELAQRALQALGVVGKSAEDVFEALTKKIGEGEDQLYKYIGISPENIDFQKVADAARSIATESNGYFLRKEFG